MGDAGFFGKGGLGDRLPGDPLGQGRGGRGGGVLPDTLLLEIAVKRLDVHRSQVLQPDMADGLIDAAQVPLIV